MNVKGLVRPKFSLFLLLGLLLVLMLAPVAKAAVWTDQADYAPGSVVTISGNNVGLTDPWIPGDTVTVEVVGPYDFQFAPIETTVGLDGTWSCQLTLSADAAVAVGDYTYTARAAGSLETQSGTFTDAVDFVVDASPTAARSGKFTIDLWRAGGAHDGGYPVVDATTSWTTPSSKKVTIGDQFSVYSVQQTVGAYTYVGWTYNGVGHAISDSTKTTIVSGQLTLYLNYGDRTAPAVTVKSKTPSSGSIVYGGGAVSVTFTATDVLNNVSGAEYRINGGAWTAATAADGSFNSKTEDFTVPYTPTAAGTVTIDARATDAATPANTSDGSTSQSFSVTKRPITVTADAKSKTYGDADPGLTYQITSGSLATGDNFTGALTRAAGESVGTRAITQGTLALSTNYTLTYVGANLTITPRPITVRADAGQGKVYGEGDPALFGWSITSGSLVTGDSFTGALTRDAGENAGSYNIIQGTFALNGNYDLTFTPGVFTINQAVLAVNAVNRSKTYGDADPALTYTLSGFKNGEDASADSADVSGAPNLSRVAGENVDTYAITVDDTGDLAAHNYSFTTGTAASFTITARDLVLTANHQTKLYGAGNPELTGTMVGVQNGDLVTDSYSTTATAASGVGDYPITPAANGTVAALANYNVILHSNTLTVTPRPITVTADAKSKVAGQLDPALTYTYPSGSLVTGDAFTGALTRDPGESWKADGYSITQGTLALTSNYDLTFVGAKLMINDVTSPTATASADRPPNANGWYRAPVTVSAVGSDEAGGSDIDSTTWKWSYVKNGVTTTGSTNSVTLDQNGEYSVTFTVKDNAHNSTTSNTVVVKIDQTVPVITLPTKTVFLLHDSSTPQWTARDLGGSGLATDASGTLSIDTSTITAAGASRSIVVTARDGAGNVTTATYTYRVVYLLGTMHFLQPINNDGSSLFKLGSTIPVKFQLVDAAGSPISGAVANISILFKDTSPDGTVVELVPVAVPNDGTLFRESGSGQYIFNLSTKKTTSTPAGTPVINRAGDWYVTATLNDGSTITDKLSTK